MKLIEQTVLVFTAGLTEKVYEIDLCEVGVGQYVVNFRYGRRGHPLKDGSRTVLPVGRVEAEREYAKLRDDKLKAGYREGGAPTPTSSAPSIVSTTPARPASSGPVRPTMSTPSPPPARPSPPPVTGVMPGGAGRSARSGVSAAQERAVLDRLRQGEVGVDRGEPRGGRFAGRARRVIDRFSGRATPMETRWRLNRAIWRAGEMRLRDAEGLLLGMLGSGRPMRDYCVAWALGFCGSSASIPTLNWMFSDASRPEFERRIAAEALLKVYDERGKGAFRESLLASLPGSLQGPARGGSAEVFAEALRGYLSPEARHTNFEVLDTIYLIDSPTVRPALLDVLRSAPLRPPWFRSIRHIFKSSEYRRDGEVFGIIAHRFEKSQAFFRQGRYGSYVRDNSGRSRWQNRAQVKEELKRSSSTIAYGDTTRWYLRQRVWWTLDRLGELDDPDYVKMCVGVLLPYADSDARATKTISRYSWRQRRSINKQWDAWASYLSFNHILYGKSPRYGFKRGSKAWFCKEGYSLGGPEPRVREESFGHLWDRVPQGLFHLMAESKCEPVHRFAVKAARGNRAVLSSLGVDAIAMMLGAAYEVTADLGFELAEARYNPSAPSRELLLAAATSVSRAARERSQVWLRDGRGHFLSDGVLLAQLMTCAFEDTRWFVREVIDASSIPDHAARGLIGRLVSHLMGLKAGEEAVARDVADLLVRRFGSLLAGISLEVVRDLLGHGLSEVQSFGADVLLAREGEPMVDSGTVEAMLGSKFAGVRGRGVRLLGRFSDRVLLGRQELLLTLLLHELGDVRDAARPIVARLAGVHPIFAAEVVRVLIDVLLANRISEEVSPFVSRVLREDLSGAMAGVSRDQVWRLLKGSTGAAQEVGGVLMGTHLSPESLSVGELVELSSHEILSVRVASRGMLERSVGRVKKELGLALGVLDSRWDDTRAWAFAYFRDRFEGDDWTPGLLVGICDSVKEDVQRFGREMITRHFQDESGQEIMLKLSEHPSGNLQLFVTHYLERYAAGDAARLRELAPYFKRVLCGINRGRVAKKRIFDFLGREAAGGLEAAEVVADVLDGVSASISVESRAEAIGVLLSVHAAHPGIAVPIRVVEVEERSARGGL